MSRIHSGLSRLGGYLSEGISILRYSWEGWAIFVVLVAIFWGAAALTGTYMAQSEFAAVFGDWRLMLTTVLISLALAFLSLPWFAVFVFILCMMIAHKRLGEFD